MGNDEFDSKGKPATMLKRDYIDMLKSMFKLMICGLSSDRLKLI